jgi:hypothetical protein
MSISDTVEGITTRKPLLLFLSGMDWGIILK